MLALTFFWPSPNKITGKQHHNKLILHLSCHVQRVLVVVTKVEQGKIRVGKRSPPCGQWWFDRKDSHSKSNKLSSPVIHVTPLLNNSVINPPQMSLVCQQSSRSSYFTPRYNRCSNSKESNSKINEFSSPVIPVPPPLNDSVINPPQMSLVCHQSSSS